MRNYKSSTMDVSGLEIVENTIMTRDFEVDGITAITFAWSDAPSMGDEQLGAIKDALWREYQWVRRNLFAEMSLPEGWAIGLILYPSGLFYVVDPTEKRLAVSGQYLDMDPDNVLLNPIDLRVALIHALCNAFTGAGSYDGDPGDLCHMAFKRVLDMEAALTKEQLYGASSKYIDFDDEHTFPMSVTMAARWLFRVTNSPFDA